MSQQNWIIVSNRLPLKLNKQGKLERGSGGLVTAITGIKSSNKITWVGAAPENVTPKEFNQALTELNDEISFHPVFISTKKYDNYYNGICNDVLWPLLHYETSYVKFNPDNWKSYVEINKKFAREIAKQAKHDELIWVHDFHLFLLPKFLKELNPSLRIGFFLHVPFPSSEIFRQLPIAHELLQGLIKADLVGFHDYSYLRHFVSSMKNLVGIDASLMTLDHDGHTTKLGVFPASIDTQNFIDIANDIKTKQVLHSNRRSMQSVKKVILGIDRLDYIKGIDLKLMAFRQLLRKNPQLQGQVQLIQLAIPSRTTVPEYITLKENIDKLIGEINGEFGTTSYVPIKYIFNSVSPYELSALYQQADVLLITSKRDGMNLVALEYIVSQNAERPGVLVLSQFAGASANLSFPLFINPWDINETADIVYQALDMPLEKRKKRNHAMAQFLMGYTATEWADSFMKELKNYNYVKQVSYELSEQSQLPADLRDKIKTADNVYLFIDYDGTLCPITGDPQKAVLSQDTKHLIDRLSAHSRVEICIVSGRERKFLTSQFSNEKINFAVEHGSLFFDAHQKVWSRRITDPRRRWFQTVQEIMQDFAKKIPNSFVEEKEHSITWHYRNSPKEFAEYQARKLKIELDDFLANLPVTVNTGKKIVEVKDLSANKGTFARWFLDRRPGENDLIIAMGDDITDEDLFRELTDHHCYTIKVGKGETCAKYFVSDQALVYPLLNSIEQRLSLATT